MELERGIFEDNIGSRTPREFVSRLSTFVVSSHSKSDQFADRPLGAPQGHVPRRSRT
jgi:hypothetical protein